MHKINSLVKKEGFKLEFLISICSYLAFPLTMLIVGTFIFSYILTILNHQYMKHLIFPPKK